MKTSKFWKIKETTLLKSKLEKEKVENVLTSLNKLFKNDEIFLHLKFSNLKSAENLQPKTQVWFPVKFPLYDRILVVVPEEKLKD